MKIEKLNDDKIRITLNLDDLKENDIDLHTFMSNSIESQELFLGMLDKAEKEVGFVTDDCRIIIEAIATNGGNFIFTITRVATESDKPTKQKFKIKRKVSNIDTKKAIYCFNTFDEFCCFCDFLKHNLQNALNKFAKHVSLYTYNEKYYLVITNIFAEIDFLRSFCSSIIEFAHFVPEANLFESKLKEYGTIIMKNNAFDICIKYFS